MQYSSAVATALNNFGLPTNNSTNTPTPAFTALLPIIPYEAVPVTMKPKGTNCALNALSFCRTLFCDWTSVLFKKRNLLAPSVWFNVFSLR